MSSVREVATTMTRESGDAYRFGQGIEGTKDTKRIDVSDIVDPDVLDLRLSDAARSLAKGGLVAFPTETVYGLGADATNPEAVARIYEAKGRPSDNPMIVHVSDVEQILPLIAEWPDVAKRLAARFMPGPLTLVLKRSDKIPDVVSAGLDTVGIRMPENTVARHLIRMAAVPVAAPSANRSGRPSPTLAAHVWQDMEGRIDYIVDGGQTSVGVESTVLDVSSHRGPRILRPGAVTYEDLLSFLTAEGFIQTEADRSWLLGSSSRQQLASGEAPPSPGMKYRHYAPKATVYILSGDHLASWLALRSVREGKKTGLFVSEDFLLNAEVDSSVLVHCFGRRSDANTAAHDLFLALRDFDTEGCELILVEALDEQGVGRAYMNRLRKAASYLVESGQVLPSDN